MIAEWFWWSMMNDFRKRWRFSLELFNAHCTYLLFVLLEEAVQIVSPFIVEVEVLTLSFTFRPHHFGNCCPVSSMFHQACSNMWESGFTTASNSLIQTQIHGTAMPMEREDAVLKRTLTMTTYLAAAYGAKKKLCQPGCLLMKPSNLTLGCC